MDATVEAFERFQGYLKQFDIEHYRAVATSAVREARTGLSLSRGSHARPGSG